MFAALGATLAHAQAPGTTNAPPWLEAPLAQEARELERSLSQSLSRFDGVVAARVHLGLVGSGSPDIDAPLPAPRAALWLRASPTTDARALAQRARRWLAAAVSGLDPARIEVVVEAPRAAVPPTLTSVGPFVVAQQSAKGLRALLACLLFACALSSGWIVLRLGRRRRSEVPTHRDGRG